jgi:hypothetical protein
LLPDRKQRDVKYHFGETSLPQQKVEKRNHIKMTGGPTTHMTSSYFTKADSEVVCVPADVVIVSVPV